jgi:hypothetical protein
VSEEDLQQQMSEWEEMHVGPDGNLIEDETDDHGVTDGATEEKEVIDLEVEEGKKRKKMTSRSLQQNFR